MSDGPRGADINVGSAASFPERFFGGKPRARPAPPGTTGNRLWGSLPYLRPMATITHDTLDWYGFDADGARLHDVIGTRCHPYTNRLINRVDHHHSCHSNLTRALAARVKLPFADPEPHHHAP